MHTYVGFVRDVNALTLESCSPGVLSMLTTDKCLHLLPITSDLSLQSRVISEYELSSLMQPINKLAVPFVGFYNYVNKQ